jgi:hypothetical protein
MCRAFFFFVVTTTANAWRWDRQYRHTLVKGGGVAVPPDRVAGMTTRACE